MGDDGGGGGGSYFPGVMCRMVARLIPEHGYYIPSRKYQRHGGGLNNNNIVALRAL